MARMSLPPGFRFHPTDTELIMYYLKRKVLGKKLQNEAISELNIYKFSPWDLPDKSCLRSKDREWYFFCPRERKYASGDRMKRGTETGYWKTTGKDRSVMYDGRVVGSVKSLVFHEGNAPHGKRTDWVMYEYKMNDKELADVGVVQDGYLLCKVFKKNGLGPKNGAQYGAPFVEEEWDNDDSGIAIDPLPCNGSSSLVNATSENQNSVASESFIDPVCTSGLPIGGSGSAVQNSPIEALNDGPIRSMVTDTYGPLVPAGCAMSGKDPSSAKSSSKDFTDAPNDDITHLLYAFFEAGPPSLNEQGNFEVGESSHGKAHNVRNVLPQDDLGFFELNDLDKPLNFSVESGGFQEGPTGSSYAVCNPDVSQYLSGILSTENNLSANLGQICSDTDFHGSETVFPRMSQSSVLPNSSGRSEGSTDVFPIGNAYENIFTQGYTAGYNLHSFSYANAEEFADTAENQERGVLKRIKFPPFSIVYPASVAAQHQYNNADAPSNSAYGGSSIEPVKAEVTGGLVSCTKDALPVMLEEPTYDYSCWWNLHGAEFWDKVADCSSRYGYGYGYGWVCCVPPFFISTTWLLLFLEMFFHWFTYCIVMLLAVHGNNFCRLILNRVTNAD